MYWVEGMQLTRKGLGCCCAVVLRHRMEFVKMLVLSLILIGQRNECESVNLGNGAKDERGARQQHEWDP